MREIALHMADIAENSLAAGAARIKLSVMIDRAADRLTTAVEDNGRGMDADTLYRCTDPFMTTRTARRVGLGIALFKLSAEQSGGSFTIRSEQGRGTRAEAAYIISGIDRAPLGSIADTMAALIAANPETDFTLEYAADGKAFVTVRNLGDTIPADELPRLFERFHKSDKSRSEDKDGVGLGLYIVKTILEQHKEQIQVTSEDGVTTFRFSLSLE